MPLNPAALDVGGEAIAAAITHASLHSMTPDATGSSIIPGVAKVPIDIDSTGGNLNIAGTVNFTGGAAGTPVAALGFWGGAGQTTWYGYATRTAGDTGLNAAGQYSATNLSIPAFAT
jgi:hypothetical protein